MISGVVIAPHIDRTVDKRLKEEVGTDESQCIASYLHGGTTGTLFTLRQEIEKHIRTEGH